MERLFRLPQTSGSSVWAEYSHNAERAHVIKVTVKVDNGVDPAPHVRRAQTVKEQYSLPLERSLAIRISTRSQ